MYDFVNIVKIIEAFLPKFFEILPNYLSNENFFECAFTPCSHTTGLMHYAEDFFLVTLRFTGVGKIFPGGGALRDFSKIFPGGAKSGEICFFPLKIKKTTFLC